jgi:HEAT repeat protein
MRVEAAGALNGVPGDVARSALLAAAKDGNARVRARAINSLGASKDPALVNVYLEHLTDESYGTIREAARALGLTKSPVAYDALTKLIETPSWRESIKVSALNGLAALEDPRALDLGLRYAAAGNPETVRGAAISVLAATGRQDPRVFPLVTEAFRWAAQNRSAMIFQAGEALVAINDKRGLAFFEQLRKEFGADANLMNFINNYEQRLRKGLEQPAAQTKPAGQ